MERTYKKIEIVGGSATGFAEATQNAWRAVHFWLDALVALERVPELR